MVGDDGTQADGYLIQSALSLDPSKMHPAFSSLSYLPDFINLHEAGHHVMGIREELAEQYGALRYRQLNPETLGTLQMMRDFRNLHLIVNDHQLVPVLYGDTSKSLSHVLSLSDEEIAAIDSNNIVQAARQGHAADEVEGSILQIDPDSMGNGFGFLDPASMFNVDEIERQMKKFGTHRDTYALSVAFFEEYEMIAPSLVSDYYLKTNRVSLFMADYFSRDDASLEGLEEAMRTTDVFALAQQAQNYDFEGLDQLDPAVLEQTVENLLVRYEIGSTEHDLLTNAKTALRNFADPLNAYNITPNFEVQPGWDDPLLDIGYNPVFGRVEYDAFGWITWELENIERRLNPDLSSPNIGPGDLFFGQGGFSAQDTMDAMREDSDGFGTHQGSPMIVDPTPLDTLRDKAIGPGDLEYDGRVDMPTTRELLDGLGDQMFDGADDNVGTTLDLNPL